MTEPQVWVLMGVFATAVFGMLSWQTISFNRTLNMAIGSVRNEMGSVRNEIGSVRNEIETLRKSTDAGLEGLRVSTFASIDALRESTNARFDVVNAKIDALDQDVQAITRHVFGTDPR